MHVSSAKGLFFAGIMEEVLLTQCHPLHVQALAVDAVPARNNSTE